MGISMIQSNGLGVSAYSSSFSSLSAQAPASSATMSIEDGIDSLKDLKSDLDQLILSKGGKQSTTVNCPEGTEPVATRDGQSMTVTCEKPVKKKDDATTKPTTAPILY